ncbi:hypothetical protein PSR1_02231 [Anaeromyxobacter sp. PSR-1]|nr:hypothetical protein PSR1_02231 [Anaeromyxobacter sp. PSR-1]
MTCPATSDRNFTPSSIDESAPRSAVAGAAPAGQMLTPPAGGAATAMLSAAPAVAMAASVTVAVKANVPLAVGVPEIAPLAARASPGGSAPAVTVHAYGGVPPVAWSAAE